MTPEADDTIGPAPALLRFGEFTVDVQRFELRRGADPVHLQPKTFDLLRYLLLQGDRVVEKDELLAALWPGVVVTEHSLTRCVKDLRKALGDDASAPRYIDTVPRRGYRMLVKLQESESGADKPLPETWPTAAVEAEDVVSTQGRQLVGWRRARPWLLGAAVLLAALVLVVSWRSPSPSSASIAVLPFVSPGGNDDARAFADGMAEDLLDRLAQVPQLQVVARTSSFAFRGDGRDVRDIGRSLGVGWVLEGSARRDDQRIVVSVQLVDARSGYRAWSERFDRPLADLFALQDEMAQAIATRAARQIAGADLPVDTHRPRDMRAHQAFVQGRDILNQRPTEWERKAVDAFAAAVALEPAYARAQAGLSVAQSLRASTAADLSQGLSLAADHASRALTLDPRLGLAHAAQGLVHLQRREFAPAEAALQRAIALDPLLAMAHGWLAGALAAQSRADESRAALQAGLRVDPLNPTLIEALADDYAAAGRWDEAHAQLSRLLGLPKVPPVALLRLDGLELERGRLGQALMWALRIERDQAADEGAGAGIAAAEALVRLGMNEAALSRLARVDVRRPLPAGVLLDMELVWRMLGRPAEAETLSRATLAAASRPWPSWLQEHRARVLMVNGQVAQGMTLLESATPAGYDFGSGGPALDGQMLRVWALRQAGQEAEASNLAGVLVRTFDRPTLRAGVSTAMQHAMARTLAGQTDRALAVLEREVEAGRLDPAILLVDDPRWAPLRTDSRWQVIVQGARNHQARERAAVQERLNASDPAFIGAR